MATVKSSVWSWVIYPDDPNYVDYLGRMAKDCKNLWFVFHDSDVDSEGSPKKPHVHVLIQYPFAAGKSTIARLVGKDNGFEPVRNLRSQLRYLIHKDDPEKYQYSPNAVSCKGETALADYKRALADEVDKDNLLLMLLDYFQHECPASWCQVCAWLVSVGAGAYLRSNSYLYKTLFDDYFYNR